MHEITYIPQHTRPEHPIVRERRMREREQAQNQWLTCLLISMTTVTVILTVALMLLSQPRM